MNDTERLDWLQQQDGCGLISDDAGRWAVACSGVQNVPDGDEASDIATSFFVKALEWRTTVREAIDAAIAEEEQG